jgi:hypothetical protein
VSTQNDASATRPPFARDYPSNVELDRLLAAFEAGDYASVREGAPKLAASTKDEQVRRAALDLRGRIDPDLVSGALLLVALALAIFLGLHFLRAGHEHPASQPLPSSRP